MSSRSSSLTTGLMSQWAPQRGETSGEVQPVLTWAMLTVGALLYILLIVAPFRCCSVQKGFVWREMACFGLLCPVVSCSDLGRLLWPLSACCCPVCLAVTSSAVAESLFLLLLSLLSHLQCFCSAMSNAYAASALCSHRWLPPDQSTSEIVSSHASRVHRRAPPSAFQPGEDDDMVSAARLSSMVRVE